MRSIPLGMWPVGAASVIHCGDKANDLSAREIAMLCDHDTDGRHNV
jgi:hypothetical protein